jgi:pimeloyl-ACP methyl ester carboxylesterase
VLLHGTASNSATWTADVQEYVQNFEVFAIDMPGEPGHSDARRFSWHGPAFAEWLDDVLDGLGLEKVTLIGMSLGAWATIKYALYKPDRVQKVILIAPSGICQPRLSFVLRMVFYSLFGEWGRNRMKQYIFRDTEFPEELDQFLTLIGKHFNYRVGAPPLFTDNELHALTMPVFFLAGRKDVLLNTPRTAERLQRLVPDLTVKIFEEHGHATVNTALHVVSFLNETALRRRLKV